MTTDFFRSKFAILEQLLGYKFKNPDLMREALSHPSLKQHESPDWHKDYERFEILGDAILGFLITELLFNKYQASDESNIAKVKAYLVSREIISAAASKINLADFIIMTKGEEESGGRSNQNNIENSMEALICAIYLDNGLESAREVVTKLWAEFIHEFDPKQMDPKTVLQEWSQKHKYGRPCYEITGKEGAVHMPEFTVLVKAGPYIQVGKGYSIKKAEKDAAKKLLDKLM